MLTDEKLPTFTSICSYGSSHGVSVSHGLTSYDIINSNSRYYHRHEIDELNNDHISFYNKLIGNSQINIPSGIIPPGLLYCSEDVLIFERPPTVKTIEWTPNLLNDIDTESEYSTFEIPVPWQIYFVHFSKAENYHVINRIFLAFSNDPIYSLDQPLYLPPLTNVYTNGQVCQPNYAQYNDLIEGTETIAGIIQNAYNQVWSSSMNLDLTAGSLKLFKHFAIPSIKVYNDRCLVAPKMKYYTNTVASNMSHVPTIDLQSYYTSSDVINSFYKSWEKVELKDICQMQWSPSDTKANDNSFYQKIMFLFSDHNFINYMTSNGYLTIDSHDNSECCEDCQYFDEDGDLIEDICAEEGSCSCHDSFTNITPYDDQGESVIYTYMQSAGMSLSEPLTFSKFFDVFMKNTDQNVSSSNNILNYISLSLNNSLTI